MLRPSYPRRVVVSGAPGAGKSTWVAQQAADGDIVWDLDAVASVMSYGGKPLVREQKGALPWPVATAMLVMRDALVEWLRRTPLKVNVFVIVTETSTALEIASDIGGVVHALGDRAVHG